MNETKRILARGIVVLVDLGKGEGSEQSDTRPCLIVSNEICNRYSPIVTVLPLTSKLGKRNLPTHVLITKEKYNIHTDSIVLAEQIKTIDTKRISSNALFKLDMEDMKNVEVAMNIQMGLVAPVSNKQQAKQTIKHL